MFSLVNGINAGEMANGHLVPSDAVIPSLFEMFSMRTVNLAICRFLVADTRGFAALTASANTNAVAVIKRDPGFMSVSSL